MMMITIIMIIINDTDLALVAWVHHINRIDDARDTAIRAGLLHIQLQVSLRQTISVSTTCEVISKFLTVQSNHLGQLLSHVCPWASFWKDRRNTGHWQWWMLSNRNPALQTVSIRLRSSSASLCIWQRSWWCSPWRRVSLCISGQKKLQCHHWKSLTHPG